jgi:PPOX class probable F420-dependent enzyme
MATIPETARAVLTSGRLAHLATINPDGSPQVTVVWVGVDGDEVVSAHLMESRKVKNLRRDPRATISLEADGIEPSGLHRYLLLHATARITAGGAPELLQELAHVYLGPEVKFPPFDDPPPGFIAHFVVERIGGVGPWNPS